MDLYCKFYLFHYKHNPARDSGDARLIQTSHVISVDVAGNVTTIQTESGSTYQIIKFVED